MVHPRPATVLSSVLWFRVTEIRMQGGAGLSEKNCVNHRNHSKDLTGFGAIITPLNCHSPLLPGACLNKGQIRSFRSQSSLHSLSLSMSKLINFSTVAHKWTAGFLWGFLVPNFSIFGSSIPLHPQVAPSYEIIGKSPTYTGQNDRLA